MGLRNLPSKNWVNCGWLLAAYIAADLPAVGGMFL